MKRSQFDAAKELYDSIDKTERDIKALEDFTSEIKVSTKAGGTIEIQIFNPMRVANTRVNVRGDALEDLIRDEIKTLKAQKKDMADKLVKL